MLKSAPIAALAGHLTITPHLLLDDALGRKEDVCVVQVGNREPDFVQPSAEYHSMSMLWTFLYTRLQGYSYHFVVDRRVHGPQGTPHSPTWLKAHNLLPFLLKCDLVMLLDFDALISDLSVPLEDKLAAWNFTERTLAMQALDPDVEWNYMDLEDGSRALNGNTGFMIFRGKNDKVQQLVRHWSDCPEAVPGCEVYRTLGTTDQAAWNLFVRPLFAAEEITFVPCDEANGHHGVPANSYSCSGKYVSHFWNAKEHLHDVLQSRLLTFFASKLISMMIDGNVMSRKE